MTATFIALAISIIIAGLTIHAWRSNGRITQPQGFGARFYFNGVEISGQVLEFDAGVTWPGTAVHIARLEIPTYTATLVWNADESPLKIVYPEDAQ